MRTYKRKTERADINEEEIAAALKSIQMRKMTTKEASAHYGIKYSTLYFRLKRVKQQMGTQFDQQDCPEITPRMGIKPKQKISKNAARQVFLQHEEAALVDYLLTCSKLNYGLTMDALRELAYLFAVSLDRQFPEKWTHDKKAGKEWALGFVKRHRAISLRKPENTSIARNSGFNRENLTTFYSNLEMIVEQHNFRASRIWNLDETGVSTVLQAPKVLGPTSAKQVGQCVSNERGEKVSIVGIISAAGDYVPPVYIFPRKRTHFEYMEGAPKDSIALFNSKGYMDSAGFLRTLEHIKTHAVPSKEDPILLILDNHSSHLTIDAIRMCREFGIHMISLPPHTSHKTQPLDLTVFGPFKAYCKKAFNIWLTEHPGQRITLHNIVRISSSSITKSFSRQNIMSGFAKSGIYPLDRSRIFKDLQSVENAAASIQQMPNEMNTDPQLTNFSADCRRPLYTSSGMSSGICPVETFCSSSGRYEPSLNFSGDTGIPMDDFQAENYVPVETFYSSSGRYEPSLNFSGDTDTDIPMDFHAENHVPVQSFGSSSAICEPPMNYSGDTGLAPDINTDSYAPFDTFSPPRAMCEIPLRHLDDTNTPPDFSNQSDVSVSYCRTSPLDFSMTSSNSYKDHEVPVNHCKRAYPMADYPLNLSTKSSKPMSVSHAQLRFGGLEILRPIPNPLVFHNTPKSSRGMSSTIVTGSPELKRKEEIEMKKKLKLDGKKGPEKNKPEQSINVSVTDNEMPLPQKKRGRPRKIPLLETAKKIVKKGAHKKAQLSNT